MARGRIRVAVIVTTAVGALSACGGGDSHSYPAESESNFLSKCSSSAVDSGASKDRATSFCGCVLTKLEKTVSYDDFKRIDRTLALGGKSNLKLRFRDAISNCQ